MANPRIQAKLEAMQTVANALELLPEAGRVRVLRWATDKFGGSDSAGDQD